MGVEDITPKVTIEGGAEAASTLTDIGEAGAAAFTKIGEAIAEVNPEKLEEAMKAAAAATGMSYDEIKGHVAAAKAEVLDLVAAHEQHAAKIKEGAAALSELGTIGAEAFSKIIKAAVGGDFTALATMIGGHLAGAITEAVSATAEFIETSARMVETLEALSIATGETVGELIGLKDAFASVGISTNGFERAVGRLAITIANDWASIAQSVRTSADHQTSAMLHMQEASLGVTKAYQALQQTLSHSVQTSQHDALSIESAALSLKRAQETLNDSVNDSRKNSLGVEGAQLALQRAQMSLNKDSGGSVSKDEERQLKIRQDSLAVSQAQLALEEASAKQMKEATKAKEEQLAVRKAEQAAADAQAKAIEDDIKSANELKQAQLNITKARLADREAAERQHEVDLKDIPKIAEEVDQVSKGYKKWDEVINHAEISTQTFTKALILNAAAGKGVATTKEVFEELAKVLPQMGDSADAQAKKIALMQQTMGAGFRAGQASAAQMLAVFQRGPGYLEDLQHSAEGLEHSLNFKQVETRLIAFNGSFASMNTVIDLFRAKLASILAVPLGAFFDAIASSLKSPEGALNKLSISLLDVLESVVKLGTTIVSGLAAVAGPAFSALVSVISGMLSVLASIIEAINTIIVAFAKMTGVGDHITGLNVIVGLLALALTGVGRALAGVVIQFAFWAVVIGLTTTAVGLLVQGLGKMMQWVPGLAAAGKAMEEFGKKVESAGQGVSRAAAKALEPLTGVGDKELNKAPMFFGKGPEGGVSGGDGGKLKEAAAKTEEAATKTSGAAAKTEEAATKTSGAADKGAEKTAVAAEKAGGAAEKASGAAEKTGVAAEKTDTAAGKTDAAAEKLTGVAKVWNDLASGLAAALKGIGAPGTDKKPGAPDNSGGDGKAAGGFISGPGTSTSDSIPAYLSNGEYVMRAQAVSQYGKSFFDAVNRGIARFAEGGFVDSGMTRDKYGQYRGNVKFGKADVGGALLDTGASDIAINQQMAMDGGIDIKKGTKAQRNTAGGTVDMVETMIPIVIKGISRLLPGSVFPDSMLSQALVGMNFLNSLTDFAITKSALLMQAAEGGYIRGPGTGTSDSIPARLSNGEFVIRSAAVSHYGAQLFDALNNINIGGFAGGGSVGAVKIPSAPTSVSASPSSTLNLTIDGNHFDGLTAPDHVASKLKTYAVTRQTTAAGKRPSWAS